jgi:ferrous iron transport protein B
MSVECGVRNAELKSDIAAGFSLREEKKTITVAVAGNPNSGKSTLINAIAGTRLHVGNWPGVTVEK